MALDHHPVQNSEVYLCLPPHGPSLPPPSPPSPATPGDEIPCLDGLATPPEVGVPFPTFGKRLETALHVLRTEASALEGLSRLYESDLVAQEGFNAAVEEVTRCKARRGKIVVTGIGKSGHIGKKLEATLNSLGITAVFMHPSEALHGDLGVICPEDTILFISNSGKTGELLQALPHFDSCLPAIIITEAAHPAACELIKQRPGTILLPAPLPISEEAAFGVKAPTISTTMALALGDALAITASSELYNNALSSVFLKNHPGGAIGAAIQKIQKLSDKAIAIIDIPEVNRSLSVAQVGFSMLQSESGWVRMGGDVVFPPRRIKKLQLINTETPAMHVPDLAVPRSQWIQVSADLDVSDARDWIFSMRRAVPGGQFKYSDDVVLVTMEEDEMCGVIEIGELLS
jgi:D-arabinose 5-phosphate isomerase GutQ